MCSAFFDAPAATLTLSELKRLMRRMLSSFPDQFNVLIVGASRGIGLGLARAIAATPRAGLIFCASRRPEQAEAVHALAKGDCRVRALRVDVCDEQTLIDAAQETARFTDTLSLVVVTAGVLHSDDGMRPERRLADLDPTQALRSWQVNALGPALVLKHFHPLLGNARRAVFGSLSARVGSIGDNRLGGWYAYRSAKAAQNQFVHTAAVEMARKHRGLVCVTLHPGTVDTDLSRPFHSGVKPDKLFSVERASEQLLGVIDGLNPSQTGGFFAWDGEPVPW
jgi:NAD(P)-dependent dehydrogenase (short-subunit alcohol dehydrogenase family)